MKRISSSRFLVGASLAALCVGAGVANAAPEDFPLLGSSHAAGAWETFCEGPDGSTPQPDSASLPDDPRSLVVPGANDGRAVFFNAWWEECHDRLPEDFNRHPATCGEYRARRERGRSYILGELSSGSSLDGYRNAWQSWGLEARPENFDELYRLRYGRNWAPYDNPYPLEGEDPNLTGGGSGQLPLGMRQIRDEDGNWTGRVGSVACTSCHAGAIGGPGDEAVGFDLGDFNLVGLGNANHDAVMSAHDSSFAPVDLPVSAGFDPFAIGIDQRGVNNAVFAFELLFFAFDYDSLDVNPNPAKTRPDHPSAGIQNTPTWWNFSHRPRKFFDAGVSGDSTRIIAAAVAAGNPNGAAARASMDRIDQDIEAFLLSLRSVPYPGDVDLALAEEGARIFHEVDLWAHPGNANRDEPLGGNGSCAGCHGAYSPRYVNDPAYLESPVLEGVAAHIVPVGVIGTDPARSDHLTPYLRDAYSTTWWAFPDGAEGWTAPEDKDPFTELVDDAFPDRPEGACPWERGVIGYQAPPLYGVWASAPYFHNGSVPTVGQVLDSSTRPGIWRRQLQTENGITGFDQRVATAYDDERLGWKHDALACDEKGSQPAWDCNPVDSSSPSLTQAIWNVVLSTFNWGAAATLPDPTEGSIEKRFIHDTRELGNSAQGHEFTDVLSDADRAAVIEYLKTL